MPVAEKLTFSPEGPETVQTLVVFELKFTCRLEEALAVSVVEPSPKLLSAGLVKVIVWLPLPIVKLCSIAGAAFQLALPVCVALIVHVPAVANVTVSPFAPEVVQTLVVFDSKPTVRPEVAVASIVIGLWSRRFSAGALNVIVWLPLPIAKLCSIGVAAFQFALPVCVALIVHVPVVRNVTVSPAMPEVAQTLVVFDSKPTGSPEDVVAVSVVEPSAKPLSAGLVKVIVWLPLPIVKLCSIAGAAFQPALPVCVALIVHVPAVANVTVSPFAPEVVQTLVVFDSKPTLRPEVAVASIVIGLWSRRFSAGAVKVIVWLPLPIVKLCSTGGAAFQLALPACVASIVHVPVARKVTFSPDGPETVQTLVVFALKLTDRPEEALAVSVVEPSPKLLSAGLVNAIV